MYPKSRFTIGRIGRGHPKTAFNPTRQEIEKATRAYLNSGKTIGRIQGKSSNPGPIIQGEYLRNEADFFLLGQ